VPRYFFHISDSVIYPDEEGSDLPDIAAARIEAVSVAGTMLRDHAGNFWETGEWRVVVTDEARVVLFSICCQALAAPTPAFIYAPKTGPTPFYVGRPKPS
jgi:hypothetical protein